MTGYSVTFTADLRTRPDVADVRPYLARALDALRGQPEVADAVAHVDARRHRITFEVNLRYGLTPDFAMGRAEVALHEALKRAGICSSPSGAAGALPAVQVRLPRWPDSIRRW
jgi:hypothetical protein